VARKKGPVLYELLRKDQAHKPWWQLKRDQTPRQAPAAEKPQESRAVDSSAQLPASRMDALEEDENALVFHLTRTQAAVVASAVILALVVFALIGLRAGKPGAPAAPNRTADAAGVAADRETLEPLAMLLPEPAAESKPDSPVKVSPQAERQAPAVPDAGENIEPAPLAAGPVAPEARTGADSRKVGLNYLVIQIIPDRPDAQEHATEIRKFLAGKGIRTIEVPGAGGGLKVLSEQGFNFDDPNDRAKLERLTEAVKKAGKEYATAKYAGRYDFRTPYPEKFKGR
jgi:hypothetical protein